MKSKIGLTALSVFVLGTLFIGFAGAYFTTPNITTWYEDLVKPPLTPPNTVFGPVWTLLYLLIGVSGWMIWRQSKKLSNYKSYISQLILNFLWSFVFFGTRNTSLAILVIALLIFMVASNIRGFYKIDKLASYLLIPYFIWILFATYLNVGINLLN